MNKEQSEICLERSKNYIKDGEYDRARRFLLKAEKLYESDEAKSLLAQLDVLIQMAEENAQSKNTTETTTEETPTSENNTQHSNTTRERQRMFSGDKKYTKEQVEAVNRLKKCSNFYEILGVEKNAEEMEIKKAYRKLALQFHPDKNHAPGAGEAFKAIGKAFNVLRDPEKRKRYDIHGDESQQSTRIRRSHNGFYYDARGFDDDFSPDDLFNMFFGGGFPNGNVRVYSNGRHYERHTRRNGHSETQYGIITQVLPILVLVFMSLLSANFLNDSPYSLSRHGPYTMRRKTGNMDVIYYVKEDFAKTYSGRIHHVENSVEEHYLQNLRTACIRERSHKEGLMSKARYFGDRKLYEQAQGLTMPSCTKFNSLIESR